MYFKTTLAVTCFSPVLKQKPIEDGMDYERILEIHVQYKVFQGITTSSGIY